ncbi:hypothetical protein SASPL_123833 [Salvia splendens]|uniref:Fungal lipase-type domain-containing protein n=1 Tax=Salvia splendens TaxID=180675 RepID=A0A8X8XR19_SALSN|nr:hypothetical protein SASPL_123833 [Salvia splendens]
MAALSQIPTPGGVLRRSFSTKDLQRRGVMRRSYSDNHLLSHKARASLPNRNNSRLFNIQLSGAAMIPETLKSFLFDPETTRKEEVSVGEIDEIEIHQGKNRGNWTEMIVELRNKWKGYRNDDVESFDVNEDGDGEGGCDVDYEEDEGGVDGETFSSLLRHVSWSDTKLFAQLAFLCNMEYVFLCNMEYREDLKRHYGLEFVTSSLEKKAAAATIRGQVEPDLSSPEISGASCSPSAAYEIAATAASYIQSQARNLIALGAEPELGEDEESEIEPRKNKSERAACVAASTMTAVVAAREEEKEKAAKDLQSLHSAPCEWFVCDDSDIYTRSFVIQGSDSLESWQANHFFEPTKFEGTNVLVHRGIYEAAKGIYEQFKPEIKEHIKRFGERARFQFTGHSLGGSLALLVNLMLLTNKEVKVGNLLPVVTFGSPFVFCGDLGAARPGRQPCALRDDASRHRAKSLLCNYPNYVAQLLKRLSGTFRSHPCLNKNISALHFCSRNQRKSRGKMLIFVAYSESVVHSDWEVSEFASPPRDAERPNGLWLTRDDHKGPRLQQLLEGGARSHKAELEGLCEDSKKREEPNVAIVDFKITTCLAPHLSYYRR